MNESLVIQRFEGKQSIDMKLSGIVFITLIAASYAAPKQLNEPDNSIFYQHTDPDARIVGGVTAPEERHRHMVALSQGTLVRSFLCGGSLISGRTVLTAAHCIAAAFNSGSLSSTLRGTVGTARWNQGGIMHAFERNVTHPNYVSATIKNDIGLLITITPVVFSNTVTMLPMDSSFQGAGVVVRVAGWGRIVAGGALSTVLLEINSTVIDGDRCVQDAIDASIELNMSAPPVEPHIEICTFHSAGFGACNGDSGSPLVRINNGHQVAIVSWGFPCARGAPDMFVRLSAYHSWVINNMVFV